MTFLWYRSNGDGSAAVFEDTPELCAQINKDARGWFGSAEGVIIHGGVIATAYTRRTVQLYDTRAWLEDGRMVPAGEATITKITAERGA